MINFILQILGLKRSKAAATSEVEQMRRQIGKLRDERMSLAVAAQKLESHVHELHLQWKSIPGANAAKGNLNSELVLMSSRIAQNRSRIDELALAERSLQQRLDAASRVPLDVGVLQEDYDDAILDLHERNAALRELKQRQAEYQAALAETPSLAEGGDGDVYATGRDVAAAAARDGERLLPPDVVHLLEQLDGVAGDIAVTARDDDGTAIGATKQPVL